VKIPFKISVQETEKRDFELNLLGKGEKVPPELLKGVKGLEGDEMHYVRDSTMIKEGITLYKTKKVGKQYVQEAYVPPEIFANYEYFIELAERLIGLSGHGYVIGDWLWGKIKAYRFKIELNGKEITKKEDFQKTLDEFIESNKS